MEGSGLPQTLHDVPVFPLPNVVLFPRAILPLHIFEERYKRMTADALAGPRLIAMALLKPGWERDYHGRPEIFPAVCVGRILSHERLPDGRYNFLLQGIARAKVESEDHSLPYRRAKLTRFPRQHLLDIDLSHERAVLDELVREDSIQQTSLGAQLSRLLASPLCCSDLADVLAFHLLDDLCIKQQHLADPCPRSRLNRVNEALKRLTTKLRSALGAQGRAGLN
jgi:Lon protease-like protein